MAITYGNVPHFSYTDRYIHDKRQGFGWDNLGQRRVRFVTLHRMVGKLWGTDGWFRNPSVSSITDFGIGNAVTSGAANDGLILRWNDPEGIRSGWASGPVSAPYGDGKIIVDKYGINAVNRFGCSIEGDGTDEPFSDNAWKGLVRFIAYWADQANIPHTEFPFNHDTGASFVIFHEEFTYGTGKRCPFPWLKSRVSPLIADVAEYMKKYQESDTKPMPAAKFKVGDAVQLARNSKLMQAPDTNAKVMAELDTPAIAKVINTRAVGDTWWYDVSGLFGTGWMLESALSESAYIPPTIPDPEVIAYATPKPVAQLAALGKDDADTASALKLVNGVEFVWVNDTVRAVRETKRLQFAYTGAKETGPVIPKGLEFDVLWMFKADDGHYYYLTPYWTRVRADDTERIAD